MIIIVHYYTISIVHYYNCSWTPWPHPHRMANLGNAVCVLTAPPSDHCPIWLPLLRPPYFLWDTSVLKLGQLIIHDALKVSKWSERKRCTSLTLNQKLETIKLGEEDMLNTKTGQKLGLLDKLAKMCMQRKRKWKNEKSYSSEYMNMKV